MTKVEYVIRLGEFDRYRHLHIKERDKIAFLGFNMKQKSKINGFLLLDMTLLMASHIEIC